jgi:hypothetical protein
VKKWLKIVIPTFVVAATITGVVVFYNAPYLQQKRFIQVNEVADFGNSFKYSSGNYVLSSSYEDANYILYTAIIVYQYNKFKDIEAMEVVVKSNNTYTTLVYQDFEYEACPNFDSKKVSYRDNSAFYLDFYINTGDTMLKELVVWSNNILLSNKLKGLW